MTPQEAVKIIEKVDICANAAETARDMAKGALIEVLEERRLEASEVCGSMNKGFGAWYADHLIAHGVTVQQWISVKDRLPEPFVSVLVQMPGEQPFPTVREGFISKDGIWQSAMFRREPGEVTHWMPLPEPPKGE